MKVSQLRGGVSHGNQTGPQATAGSTCNAGGGKEGSSQQVQCWPLVQLLHSTKAKAPGDLLPSAVGCPPWEESPGARGVFPREKDLLGASCMAPSKPCQEGPLPSPGS